MNTDDPADTFEFESWKPRLSPLALAEIVVDAMIDGGFVAKPAFDEATKIAAVELGLKAKHDTASALASSVVHALVKAHLVLPSDLESCSNITASELDIRRLLESRASL